MSKAMLDDVPLKPTRSKLEPHTELILELYKRDWSYRQIAGLLWERYGITAGTSTVYSFVRVRSKRKAEVTIDHGELTSHRSVPSSLSEAEDVDVRMSTLESQPVAPVVSVAPLAARQPAASGQPASAGYVRSSDKSRRTSSSTDRYAAVREQMRRDKETPMSPVTKRKLFEYTEEDATAPLGRGANPSKEQRKEK